MIVVVYDANNDVLLVSHEIPVDALPGRCDWELNIEGPNPPYCTSPSLCTIPESALMPFTFEFIVGEQEFPKASYYFAYASVFGSGDFYDPFGPPPEQANQDFHFRYYAGDKDFEPGMYTTPEELSNSPQRFTEQFVGDDWVLPYNADYLCEQSVLQTGTTCKRVYNHSRVFVSPLVGLPDPAAPTYTFAAEADVVVPAAYHFDWDTPGLEVRFHQSRKLRVEGDLTLDGVALTQADGQGWGGIDVLGTGGDLDLKNDAVVEHAATGVTVYDPATATIMNSTLRNNGVGLDVLSDGGTTVSGSVIEQNGTGIRSGVPQAGPGATVPCFGACRSTLTVFDSEVVDNTSHGVYAISVYADIRETVMSDNGGSGLRVSNATVDPFNENILEGNSGAGAYDGLWVLAAGNLQMRSLEQNPYGVNRVANNGGRELAVASGGTVFIGTASTTSIPNNGRNSIYDTNGGVLIANYSGTQLQAGNTYWDNYDAPPAGFYTGAFVKWPPASNCDYTVPDDPDCIAESRGTGNRGTGADAFASGARGGDDLRAEIRAVRGALAANPSSEEAPGLVRTLAALHRGDRGDETGEYAASWGLLRSLRARLSESGNGLPAALRPAAEAALEAEAVERLTRGERDQARTLVAMASLTEGGGVDRVLSLVEAHLEVAEGRYAEAAAMVEAVATEEATEGDPESGLSEALLDLAAVFAERAGDGAGARGVGAMLAQADATMKGAEAADGREALAVYPNPSTASATVALTMTEAADVEVAVYDVLGRRVALLSEGVLEAGTHRFALDGSGLPAGVYLVRSESSERHLTARITLLK